MKMCYIKTFLNQTPLTVYIIVVKTENFKLKRLIHSYILNYLFSFEKLPILEAMVEDLL